MLKAYFIDCYFGNITSMCPSDCWLYFYFWSIWVCIIIISYLYILFLHLVTFYFQLTLQAIAAYLWELQIDCFFFYSFLQPLLFVDSSFQVFSLTTIFHFLSILLLTLRISLCFCNFHLLSVFFMTLCSL